MKRICLVFATCPLRLMRPPGRRKCKSRSNAPSFAAAARRSGMNTIPLFASFVVVLLSGRKLNFSEKVPTCPGARSY
jgi:hypothetical protein